MKIKVKPQDFIVEEICDYQLTNRGEYAIYQLNKESWDTFDLLDYLSRKYHLKNIGRAGIKDRYSHSIQYLSIKHGPKRDIQEKNFTLSYLGQSQAPITLNNLLGNKFTITIRDLAKPEIEYLKVNLEQVKKYGIINYYDEQRMGSARAHKGFIAEKLVKKHYNGALKLYLATPSKYDDSKMRKLKKHILNNWGNWQKCLLTDFDYSQLRYPLLYLNNHPKNFKGAIKTIRKDLLEMFINAYQAYLWNETVKELVKSRKIDYFKVNYGFGELYFYEEIDQTDYDYLSSLDIQAPSYKAKFTDHKIKELMDAVLQRDNLSLSKLKLDLRIKGLFFKPYARKVLMHIQDLKLLTIDQDDLYPNQYKFTLSFILDKGSYATILLKRISHL
ncbi:MAG: tRNA pseudouridine(13) synthase TruD [candidate division WOR-3 bacterium]